MVRLISQKVVHSQMATHHLLREGLSLLFDLLFGSLVDLLFGSLEALEGLSQCDLIIWKLGVFFCKRPFHVYHVDSSHQGQPLLLVHPVHLGWSAPERKLVGSDYEYGLLPSLTPFFRKFLEQVRLHGCSYSFEELEDIRQIVTLKRIFNVELRDKDDLSLPLLTRVRLDDQSTSGERGPLTDKDLKESPHHL